jgi:hypothetical protein
MEILIMFIATLVIITIAFALTMNQEDRDELDQALKEMEELNKRPRK